MGRPARLYRRSYGEGVKLSCTKLVRIKGEEFMRYVIKSTFSERLLAARITRGLTQKELARRAKIYSLFPLFGVLDFIRSSESLIFFI